MVSLIDKLELHTFLGLVASIRGPPPSPLKAMILIDDRACNRDITAVQFLAQLDLLILEWLENHKSVRPNKKISVFRVKSLNILGRVDTHILFNYFFSGKKILFYAF